MQNDKNISNRNLILAIIISTLVVVGWSYLFPQKNVKSSKSLENHSDIPEPANQYTKDSNKTLDTQAIKQQEQPKEVIIENHDVLVAINTQGLKIQNITLKNNDVHSPLIDSQVFTQVGFLSQTHTMPNQSTVWSVVKSDKKSAIFKTVQNGITFLQTISFDKNSMLHIKTDIQNNVTFPISFMLFSRVNQSLGELPEKNAISHEGAILYSNSTLNEKPYHKLKKQNFNFESTDNKKSWLGFSDKYTLIAFITTGEQKINFVHSQSQAKEIFQVDTVSSTHVVNQNAISSFDTFLFIGKKRLRDLEEISRGYDIPHFDKSIDFGFLYFITKPIFLLLHLICRDMDSFALAIVVLTLLIKLILLPLTIKSSISMAKMKKLQPEVARLQEQYKNDKQMLGQATIKLYKEKQVNPLAGCLPMLVQIPIFFALYKVLYVSTEMKNAHLFFWIKDLSSPDPTSILNLFGLLPFNVPPFLGVLPILFGISMFFYQKASPQPADKSQAQIMKFLPLIMTVFLSGFAAGLLFYWIVSNIISIIQQIVIEKFILPRHNRKNSHNK
jgi:YidC/Oxa1 family membrane protein insertase